MDIEKLNKLNELASELDEIKLGLEYIDNASDMRFKIKAFNRGDLYVLDGDMFKSINDKLANLVTKEMRLLYEKKKQEFESA